MRHKKQKYDRFGNRFVQHAIPDPNGTYVPRTERSNTAAEKQSPEFATSCDAKDECRTSKKIPLHPDHFEDDVCHNTHTIKTKYQPAAKATPLPNRLFTEALIRNKNVVIEHSGISGEHDDQRVYYLSSHL